MAAGLRVSSRMHIVSCGFGRLFCSCSRSRPILCLLQLLMTVCQAGWESVWMDLFVCQCPGQKDNEAVNTQFPALSPPHVFTFFFIKVPYVRELGSHFRGLLSVCLSVCIS